MAWRRKAECADMPPMNFFPVGRENVKHVLAVCQSCVVREECLKYALDNGIEHGIWGGLTESQRKKLKRASA